MMYVKAVVQAGSKKESIKERSKDHFLISVKEKAEKNLANKRVIEILSLYFKVPTGKIRIVNGHHHSHKLLVVEENL